MEQIDEDAWGSDLDLEPSHSNRSRNGPVGLPRLPDTSLGIDFSSGGGSGVCSLQSICLGVIALHLDEVLEYGEEVLPWLPSDIRASLFAVARRKGLVADDNLTLFPDDSWCLFDVSGTSVSSPALEAIAERMPSIRGLDLSDCQLGPKTVEAFAQKCPHIEILRLKNVKLSEKICLSWLGAVLPCVEDQDEVGDSWEDEVDDATYMTGRWRKLRYITWPGIPPKLQSFISGMAPEVMVISSMQQATGALPPFVNPGLPMDLTLLAEVGSQAWGDSDPGSDCKSIWSRSDSSTRLRKCSGELFIPIAEKFRLAYEEIDARRAAKMERNYKQKKRREAKKSRAEQALSQWLDAE